MPAERHTHTPHSCTLLTVLHCQGGRKCLVAGQPHTLSARMPGGSHGQPTSAQMIFSVLSCQCVLLQEEACCLISWSWAALAQDFSCVSFSHVWNKSPLQQSLCASSSFGSLPFSTGPWSPHYPGSCRSHVQHFHRLTHSATDWGVHRQWFQSPTPPDLPWANPPTTQPSTWSKHTK